MAKVLIVDDQAENLYLLECLFKGHGYEVITASNGREALDQTREGLPDLVVSDVLMPVMDGFSLCRRWKQDPQLRTIPFVFYTATYTDPKDEQFALSLGADLFMVKPTEPDDFLRAVHSVVDRQQRGELRREVEHLPAETPYLIEYNQALVRKLEDKLVELEEANRALLTKDRALASAASAILFADESGRVNYVNSACRRLWGLEEAECLQMNLRELFAAGSGPDDMLRQVDDLGSWTGELQAKGADGADFVVQVVAHQVRDARGTSAFVMVSCIDITQQKRLQEALHRSRRLEALSLFAAGIAHDFNNLLTGLFNSLELGGEAPSVSSPEAARLATVRSAFEKARDLTQRLIAFAKGGPQKRRLVRVDALARECCSLSLSGSSTRCEFQMDESLWPVEVDASQLSQVFDNLVINARQAMMNAGTLEFSAHNARLEPGHAGPLLPGDYVVIRLRDHGPGIPDEILPKVFDPFFTTKADGTGLGLASSYAIVHDHGGHLAISSARGDGTTVEVWLPAHPGGIPESERRSVPVAHAGTGRVLLMDDEDLIRMLGERMLIEAGYKVSVAANGEAAVELYRHAMAEGKPYDLVLLDLTVRGGMGGLEALEELHRIDPQVVALASSGYSDEETRARVRSAGFVGILPKPYLRHELTSTVKGALGSPRGTLPGA
jgi:PAS domain S-box-containing protein